MTSAEAALRTGGRGRSWSCQWRGPGACSRPGSELRLGAPALLRSALRSCGWSSCGASPGPCVSSPARRIPSLRGRYLNQCPVFCAVLAGLVRDGGELARPSASSWASGCPPVLRILHKPVPIPDVACSFSARKARPSCGAFGNWRQLQESKPRRGLQRLEWTSPRPSDSPLHLNVCRPSAAPLAFLC